MTTEELSGRGDPVIRRLQRAFAHEEPATELATVAERAGRYLAPAFLRHDLTAADLSAARRREPAAVTRVYTAYAPALYRFFMAAVSDRHLAEDLTGTAFVSAIEALPRFRGPVEALGGWLFQIARHDLYDYRRKQQRSPIEPLEERLDPDEWAMEQQGETLMAALRELSPDQREVLVLRLCGGLTAPEVAAVLGKSTGAVKALQHRGLAGLARLLVSMGEDPSWEGSGSPRSAWGDGEGTAWEPRPRPPGP